MEKRTEEWLRQSDQEYETAEIMFESGRYIFALFMCRLAIERALESLIFEKSHELPMKNQSLVSLLTKLEVWPPEDFGKVIAGLGEAKIATRSSEDLAHLQQFYTENVTRDLMIGGQGVIVWKKNGIELNH